MDRAVAERIMQQISNLSYAGSSPVSPANIWTEMRKENSMNSREIFDAADDAKAAATIARILSDKIDEFEKNVDMRFRSIEEKIDRLERLFAFLDNPSSKSHI